MQVSFKIALIFIFTVLITVAMQAQMVISETVLMDTSFNIDLTNKKIQKAVAKKGVKHVEWDEDKRALSITYDPRRIQIKQAMALVKEASLIPPMTVITLPPTGFIR
jgi:uncharacterized protein YunC (DUF1805 family)